MSKQPSSWRNALGSLCLILGLILAPLSIAGLWATKYVTNTDGFVQTLAPVAGDSALQQDVADNVTTAVSEQLRIEDRLTSLTGDGWLSALVPAEQLAEQADEIVNSAVLGIVQSNRFATLWENSLRASHAKAVAILAGQSDSVSLDKAGVLTFQLSDVLGDMVSSLTDLGIPGLETVTNAEWDVQVFQSDALPTVQRVYQLIETFGPWLVYVAAAFLVAGILLRPSAITPALLSLGVVLGLCALAVKTLLADFAGERLFTNLDREVADTLYAQITAALSGSLLTTAVVALVLGAAAWPISTVVRRRVAQQRVDQAQH